MFQALLEAADVQSNDCFFVFRNTQLAFLARFPKCAPSLLQSRYWS